MRKLIIGIGTGRCGTLSLSRLLSAQPGMIVPHEYGLPLPWIFSQDAINKKIFELKRLGGDVAFYYLNYVNYLNHVYPFTKFVCIKREREATINSYLTKSENRNNWIEHDGSKWMKSPIYYNSYPKFSVNSKREALGMYYDLYYMEAEKLKSKIGSNFKIFSVEDLNKIEGIKQILVHCGFSEHEMVITKCHFNKSTKNEF